MSNVCECPDPPGGSVRCAPDHYAYCVVVRGKTKTGCYKPNRRALRLSGSSDRAFMRHIARGLARSYANELLGRYSEVIKSHQFMSDDGNLKMKFTIPAKKSS